MKKSFSIFLLSVFCFSITSCVVPKAGLNFASERSEFDSPGFAERTPIDHKNLRNVSSTSSETGFYIGLAFYDDFLQLSDDFSVQPEVNFLIIEDLNQLQVPVLAKYNFADGFNAYAGPNFGFLVDAPNGIKSFNFALDAGLSYDITDNFIIEARYDYGLSNLLDNAIGDSSVKLRNFQVGLAYRFNE